MAQIKKKAPAGTSNNSTQPGTVPDGPPLDRQAEETNPQIEDVTTEAGLHGGPAEEDEATEALQTQSAELTEAALQLKVLQKKREIIEAQLATKKRALDQANKLAEARRKLAEMEAEVEHLQRAYQDMPGGSTQQ